ncbi:phytanoyl-CoA dioxygenase [Altererythrobacter xixiisoli]|uniref:Phytanoyl-CoA dioxygenase n=1 Tax=Croceibacterium xixiisoli TaxID=1476466 RepID=A0A6I4TTE1_9SPHN|nr:phytanoyl-CoA dioxygenase family protein [Croceibacterium xixiisoli]MXO97623.1 phytanoyl-CoA dioxygenase [Croceibacterium xixiisoli]
MSIAPASLQLAVDGAQHHAGAADGCIDAIIATLADFPADQAGIRLQGIDRLQPLLAPAGPVGAVAALTLGPDCRPVRAILFDKTAARNWPLGWHQDRTICVAERRDAPGFGPWTVKHGLQHVAPPFNVLARMITLRVHLDDVDNDNAPLKIACGSHQMGLISVPDVSSVVAGARIAHCLARAGDIWAYTTPILHASDSARNLRRRRVLQIDYAAGDLPHGLHWLGV